MPLDHITSNGKECQLGEQVKNLDALMQAAHLKLSVIVPKSYSFNYARPAAFAINLPGSVLYRHLQSGMFIYLKKSKANTKPTP